VAVARAALLEAFDRWAAAQSDSTLKRMATVSQPARNIALRHL
jgi:kinesin family protein 6/9